MDFQKSKKLLLLIGAAYIILAAMIFFVAGDGFKRESVSGSALSQASVIGEITEDTMVSQRMLVNADCVETLNVEFSAFGRANTGTLHIAILAKDGATLVQLQESAENIQDGSVMSFQIPGGISGRKGEYVFLKFWAEDCGPGNAVSIYYGNSVAAGKYEIAKTIDENDAYSINGVTGSGVLCAYFSGYNNLIFYVIYWPIVAFLLAIASGITYLWWRQAKNGRQNALTVFCSMVIRYGFLMRQLVSRDFKKKYKRSVLGVGWSILNPVLTMAVQYVIFSTLFSNGTKNYPVYLLSGIVIYSFFNDAITMGMTSIVNNAPLIKKVYMPKYVYPVSRVITSLINLGTSMIPLVAVMLLTGLWPKPAFLLLIYDVLCLIIFTIGVSLILATCMTFFQDTLFLWSVVSMIWMYLTPIFYMETIIPEQFLIIYHMNPLYQFISFARTCIIDGMTPAPLNYLYCAVAAGVALIIGITVFRKNQNRFVLYL